MFKENQTAVNETDTIIGPSVKVEGDFITEGNIIVEGMICGTIKTSQNLKVGPDSKIFANIGADNALVAGEIQGNITIKNKLELTSTARIYGDIKTGTMSVAGGALINGKCTMTDTKDRTPRPESAKQKRMELKPLITQEK